MVFVSFFCRVVLNFFATFSFADGSLSKSIMVSASRPSAAGCGSGKVLWRRLPGFDVCKAELMKFKASAGGPLKATWKKKHHNVRYMLTISTANSRLWLIIFVLNLVSFFILTTRKIDRRPLLSNLSFWSFFTFLHHRTGEVERRILWKPQKKKSRKSWLSVPLKLLACIGFLYKVGTKPASSKVQSCLRD